MVDRRTAAQLRDSSAPAVGQVSLNAQVWLPSDAKQMLETWVAERKAQISRLIDRSSLGTPGAKRLRARVSRAEADALRGISQGVSSEISGLRGGRSSYDRIPVEGLVQLVYWLVARDGRGTLRQATEALSVPVDQVVAAAQMVLSGEYQLLASADGQQDSQEQPLTLGVNEIQKAIGQLPASQRAALISVDMYGIPAAEVARILNVPETSVGMTCAQGRGALAQYWGAGLKSIRVLGFDHPDSLTIRSNLAHWRGEHGDAAGAAAAYKELLTTFERALGPDHPDTLTIRSNLAGWRGGAGDVAGAVAAYKELLADRVRVLGPDHPDTLTSRIDLAHWRGRARPVIDLGL